MHVLIVKTSSLGDLIHALPAVQDAVQALPGLRFDWIAERPFAEIPGWHPAIDRVLGCDLRTWRRRPLQTLRSGDWARFRDALGERRYAQVIDAQGLLKSAWLASRAVGPVSGPDFRSAREPLAALFYERRLNVPAHDRAHAVERNRRLFAQALGYALPDLAAAPDYGLDPGRFPRPQIDGRYAMFLHGTTWPSKRWPLEHWQTLGRWLATTQGLRPVLAWGSEAERQDAVAIARQCDGLVLPRLGLTALGGWLAQARVVVGVDTGLMHFAAALATPGLSLYGPTLPQLTGAVGRHQHWLQADAAVTTVDRERALDVSPNRVQQALLPLLAETPR